MTAAVSQDGRCSGSPTAAGAGYCSPVTDAAAKVDAKRGFSWRKAVQGFVSVGLVVAIFVFAIPKFASYSQVWPILKGLSAAQIVWLVLAQFLNSDEAPWNYMMATAIVYALPPVAIYYAFRRRMTAGLTMGGVKG